MKINEYLKKYPWTREYGPYPENPDEELACALMWLPEGWLKAFGEEMCYEIDEALKKTDFYDKAYISEAKEKYASMRLSICPSNEEIDRILLKYETISMHVCEKCGAVDVPVLNIGRWWSVYCQECYEIINADGRHKPYDEVIDGDAEMPAKIQWGRFSTEHGHENFEMDISETVEKIRENYKKRMQKERES